MQILKKILNQYVREKRYKIRILSFNEPALLMDLYLDLDILFLEIKMKEADGLEIARRLRSAGKKTRIIFLTKYREKMQKAFRVKAFDYLCKPCKDREIIEVFDRALTEILDIEGRWIRVKDRDIFIKYRDIRYIESIGDFSNVNRGEDDNLMTSYTLKEWEKMLDYRFIRCHKSFIVNLTLAQNMQDRGIIVGNKEIPVSIRNKNLVKRAYQEIISQYGKWQY